MQLQMLKHGGPSEDFVLAKGRCVVTREFIEFVAKYMDNKQHLESLMITKSALDPTQKMPWCG